MKAAAPSSSFVPVVKIKQNDTLFILPVTKDTKHNKLEI